MTIITYTENTKSKLEIAKTFLNSLPVKDWNFFTEIIETVGKDNSISPEDFKMILGWELELMQMTEEEELAFIKSYIK